MPKVYVVQENPNIDYSDAERFGDVIFMTMSELQPMRNSRRNAMILGDIESHVMAFNPEEDYVLLSGNLIAIGYAFSLLMAKSKGVLRCLQYSRIDRKYKEFEFNPEYIKNIATNSADIMWK